MLKFKAMKKDKAKEEQNAFLEHLRMHGATEEEVIQIAQHIELLQKEMNKSVRHYLHKLTKKTMVKPIITGTIFFSIPQVALIAFGLFNIWSYVMGASIFIVAICLIYAITFRGFKTTLFNHLNDSISVEVNVNSRDDGEGDES